MYKRQVLWECGPVLATAAVKAGCIQEFITFLAPKIIGGENGMNPFSDFEFESMNQVMHLNLKEVIPLSKDIYLRSLLN